VIPSKTAPSRKVVVCPHLRLRARVKPDEMHLQELRQALRGEPIERPAVHRLLCADSTVPQRDAG